MPLTAKLRSTLRWLPSYLGQRLTRPAPSASPLHLILAVANHFEPEFLPGSSGRFADLAERVRRVHDWCERHARLADPWRDTDGLPLRHSYFFPAEHYHPAVIKPLARHCQDGWGELEVHLHHGLDRPDTPDNLHRVLSEFRDALATHGSLSRERGSHEVRYAFVHGNWALANSGAGRFCGVDEELEILARTGCYADFTLPSAPDSSQVAKINALYECALPLHARAPHRAGRDLRVGHPPCRFPLIIQGPLGLPLTRPGYRRPRPYIENGALTALNPASLERLRRWVAARVMVRGRPDWVFIKLHCHGMDPADTDALLGEPMTRFLQALLEGQSRGRYHVHFVSAREMVNIALAACEGHTGRPGAYRDHRFVPLASRLAPLPSGVRPEVSSMPGSSS